MGNKKDDSCSVQEPSFSWIGCFLPVSTLRGPVHYEVFFGIKKMGKGDIFVPSPMRNCSYSFCVSLGIWVPSFPIPNIIVGTFSILKRCTGSSLNFTPARL